VGEARRAGTIDQRLTPPKTAPSAAAATRTSPQPLASSVGFGASSSPTAPHTRLKIMPATMPPRTLTIRPKGL
jgi:hypothetical protein